MNTPASVAAAARWAAALLVAVSAAVIAPTTAASAATAAPASGDAGDDQPTDGAATQDQPPAVPAAHGNPALDVPLRRVIQTGCASGVPELSALAAARAEGSEMAAEVVRLCTDIVAQQPLTLELTRAPSSATSAGGFDHSGRSRLALASTLYGLWGGIAVDVLADVNNERVAVLLPMLGMTGGLVGSLWATHQRDITAGQAWSIITGLDYGTYSGLLWSATSRSASATSVVGWSLAAGLAGGALGTLVAAHRPDQGAVEMTRSGGLWGTTAALMLTLMAAPDNVSSEATFTALAIGMDAGLAGGAWLGWSHPVSRNRMLLIDSGTLAGLVLGVGGTWLVTGDQDVSRRAVGAVGLAGMVAGMAVTAVLTRGMAAASPGGEEIARSTVPAVIERNPRGRWRLGSLGIVPAPGPAGSGRAIAGATATLVGGNF